MEVIINTNADEVSKEAARIFSYQIKAKPTSVLGLATGSTPLGLYRELIARFESGQLDFSSVTSFNLDEYVGLHKEHPCSYSYFMGKNLFSKINILPQNVHIPDGTTSDIPKHCAEYEQEIRKKGGIDLQLLGLGSDGHIGFNEPSSSLSSRTRLKTLTERTISDNAHFFKSSSEVPHHVITMGIGTIMEAQCCLVIATGTRKAAAVAAMAEGPITAELPASIMQMHSKCILLVDEEAASNLKRSDYYRWIYKNKPDWQKA